MVGAVADLQWSHLDLRRPDLWLVCRISPRSSSGPGGSSRPRFKPFQPRGRAPGPPARVERPPGAPPARSARRSPRGGREGAALTSPGAGCGGGSRLQAPDSRPAAAALCAPRRDGSFASPGHGHFHFPQLYRQESESENRREAGPVQSAQ